MFRCDVFINLLHIFQVIFAFMVGLHNLYWYYGTQTYEVEDDKGMIKLAHSTEAFQGWVPILILRIERV